VIEGIGDRVLGPASRSRTSGTRFTNRVIVQSNGEIDEEKVAEVEESRSRAGEDPVGAHLPVGGQGVCIRCYGRHLARGHAVNLGRRSA